MNNKATTFNLDFLNFSLEFDVWIELSSEWTKKFPNYASDFVFAIADTYISVSNSRHLLIPEDNPGNFIVTLEELSKTFREPKEIPNIEKIISCGELHKWMIKYWENVQNEKVTSSEDALYDLLFSTTIMDAKEGNVSIYYYKNTPIIEVTSYVFDNDKQKVFSCWNEFDSEIKYKETKSLQQLITASILNT